MAQHPEPAPADHQQIAVALGQVRKSWHTILMKSLGITLVELRQDRLLDELIAHGPDPLYFMTVFGCSDTTALHYLRLAEQLLSDDPRFRPLEQRTGE
jgi:hypothetical protein